MFVSGLFWDGTLYNLDFFIRQLESVILSTVQRGQLKLYVLSHCISQWLADLPKYEQPAAWDTTEWHVPCDPVHNLFWEVGDHSLSLPVVMICAVEQCHAWRSGPWSRKGGSEWVPSAPHPCLTFGGWKFKRAWTRRELFLDMPPLT